MNPIADVVGGVVEGVGKIIDNVYTSDEERLKADIESMKVGLDAAKIDADLIGRQVDVNIEEAKSASVFVSGWRPALGWVCVLGFGYQYVVYPFLVWLWTFAQAMSWIPKAVGAPPLLEIQALAVLLTGMLGLATNRTFEKVKGVSRIAMKD